MVECKRSRGAYRGCGKRAESPASSGFHSAGAPYRDAKGRAAGSRMATCRPSWRVDSPGGPAHQGRETAFHSHQPGCARQALIQRARFRAEHCPASLWVFCRVDGSLIQSVKRSFGTAYRRAGIRDFHIHDMRHTCAAWLVTAGVPLPEVRDLLGHSTMEMTERYAHLAPENVRAAVTRLEKFKSHFGHSNDSGNQKEEEKNTVTKWCRREFLVGVRGFEPPAPASRRQCSTRLSYTPFMQLISSIQRKLR